jgi:hypothetical protein
MYRLFNKEILTIIRPHKTSKVRKKAQKIVLQDFNHHLFAYILRRKLTKTAKYPRASALFSPSGQVM